MAAEREKMFECEVRRRRVKAGGGYEPYWKVKNVAVALSDADTEFRCKDCGGELKLFRTHKPDGPGPHVEHKKKDDSEYCPAGLHFRKATDGREPRRSASEVH